MNWEPSTLQKRGRKPRFTTRSIGKERADPAVSIFSDPVATIHMHNNVAIIVLDSLSLEHRLALNTRVRSIGGTSSRTPIN